MDALFEFFSYDHFTNLKDNPKFRKSYRSSVRFSRIEERRLTRRQTRQSILFARRNITEMDTMTPTKTPKKADKQKTPKKSEILIEKPKKSEIDWIKMNKKKLENKTGVKTGKPDRLQLLLKWKKEKEERLKKQKLMQKPTFKVGHAEIPSIESLPFVSKNTSFKAPKNVKPIGKTVSTVPTSTLPSFAPKNSTFKPPKNIKPIPMNLPKPVSNQPTKPPVSKSNSKTNLLTNKSVRPNVNINKNTTLNSASNGKNNVKKSNSVPISNDKKPVQNTQKLMSNHFLRVTRSQKPVASPPLPLPRRKKPIVIKRTLPNGTERKMETVEESNKENLNETKVHFDIEEKTPTNKRVYKKTPLKKQKNIDLSENSEDSIFEIISGKISEEELENDSKTVLKENFVNQVNKRKSVDSINLIETIMKKSSEEEDDEKLYSKRRKSWKRKSNKIEDSEKPKTPVSNRKLRKSLGGTELKQEKTLSEKKSRISVHVTELEDVSSSKRKTRRSTVLNTPKNSDVISSAKKNIKSDDLEINISKDLKLTTPENKRASVYLSPFVTTSRGKGSSKKENKSRQSRGFGAYLTNDPESNEAGALYFHNVLDKCIERLLGESKKWEQYKEDEEISEDAKDLINVAVGQTHLLINKKFEQFRSLINNCQNGGGEGPVSCADLQGFWDMVYMQVDNLDLRFKRLQDLKDNNWEEILPTVQKTVPLNKKRPVSKTKAPAAAKSNIRDAIKAARLKSKVQTKDQNNDNVFNGGFFVITSPNKTPNNKTPSKKRKSMLVSVLSTEAKKKAQNCTPGLTTLRLSQTFKSIGKNKTDLNQTMPTPGKSILKKSNSMKAHNNSKVVLFKDEDSDSEENRTII